MNGQLMEKQKRMYESLTKAQLKILEDYLANDMKNLKKICNPIIFRKGVPQMDWDDLYAVASDTLIESLVSYDNSKGSRFHTYLMGNINRAFYDWTRDNRRGKRCNLERDKNGKVVKDENGKPIVITDISLNDKTEEGTEIGEMVDSGYRIEDNLSDEIGFLSDDKIERYLSRLSKRQKKIVLLLSDGYLQDEIRELLHMNKKEYADNLFSIRAYENIRILL